LRDALGRLDPPETAPGKLVANLPYAVAATVVLDYFERFPSLGSATVMVQKEVADRMAAVPGTKNYGAYTVKLRLYAEPAGRFGVGPGNFFPPPRVESAVLRLDRRPLHGEDGAPLAASTLKAAATMADAAFANRRKTLSNSCKTYFASRGVQGARIAAALPQLLEQAAVDPKIRGEALALEDFIRLGTALEALGA
ncbi:MAG: ribosomal RNA small subunit methyltransferase A, partial [Gordonibacter urolithinfaciens]